MILVIHPYFQKAFPKKERSGNNMPRKFVECPLLEVWKNKSDKYLGKVFEVQLNYHTETEVNDLSG